MDLRGFANSEFAHGKRPCKGPFTSRGAGNGRAAQGSCGGESRSAADEVRRGWVSHRGGTSRVGGQANRSPFRRCDPLASWFADGALALPPAPNASRFRGAAAGKGDTQRSYEARFRSCAGGPPPRRSRTKRDGACPVWWGPRESPNAHVRRIEIMRAQNRNGGMRGRFAREAVLSRWARSAKDGVGRGFGTASRDQTRRGPFRVAASGNCPVIRNCPAATRRARESRREWRGAGHKERE